MTKVEPKDFPESQMTFIKWLAILFIYLKLDGAIDWSWWLVLSPITVRAAVVWLWVKTENAKIEGGAQNDQ